MEENQSIKFDEDAFDLSTHKEAANRITKRKAFVRRVHRQLFAGKVILAIIALGVFSIILVLIATGAITFI